MVNVPNMRLAPISVCFLSGSFRLRATSSRDVVRGAPRGTGDALSAADGVHIVAVNDSLYGISQRYGVSARSIIGANRLQPPYRLIVGQRLKLPPVREFTASCAVTRSTGISRQYGVAMSKLASLNDLKPPYRIMVGRSLRLPGAIEATLSKLHVRSCRRAFQTLWTRGRHQSQRNL